MTEHSEIRVVEAHRTGFVHASFNAAVLESMAAAYPAHQVVFAAESDHSGRVVPLLPDNLSGRVRTAPLDEGRLADAWRRHRSHASDPEYSVRKAWAARRLLSGVLSDASGADRILVTSVDAPILTALWSLRRVGPRVARRTDVILHGELADVTGWRARRPLTRALQLRSSLRRWLRSGGVATVLEPHIPEALRAAVPELGSEIERIRIFPHPIPTSSARLAAESGDGGGDTAPPTMDTDPVRIGFLGRVTRDKGIEEFVRLARRFEGRSGKPASTGRRPRFEVHGWLPPDATDLDLEGLDLAPSPTPLSREAYVEALRSLDYVCLPLTGAYYDFAASGTLLDAVAGLTPILTLDTPMSRGLFTEAGDIGFLCEDEAALTRAVERIVRDPDRARRDSQVERLRAFRASRHPTLLGGRLRTSEGDPTPAGT